MTYLVVVGFIAIIASLGAALFFMLRGGEGNSRKDRMAKALAFRIGFSVLLFVCILVAWQMGYIQPTGIPLNK